MRFGTIFLAMGLAFVAGMPAAAADVADAVLAQARAALAQGQYHAAETLVDGALAGRNLPDLARARLLVSRGLARQAEGKGEDALADFTMALSIGALPPPERGRALFGRGVTLDSLDRRDDAVGDYSAVLAIDPKAAYALNNRANVWRRQGRLDEAKQGYRAALAAGTPNPQYPDYGLGQIAEAQGDTAAARDLYAKALEADPGYSLAAVRLKALGGSNAPPDDAPLVLHPPPAPEPIVLRPPSGKVVAQNSDAPVASHPPRRPAPTPHPAAGGLRTSLSDGAGPPHHAGALVQLGAWRSEAEARQGWAVAQAGADGLLEGRTPVIVTATLPGRGLFYRLRVEADGAVPQFCAKLMEKGLACIPARD